MKPSSLFTNTNFITPHILEYGWIKKRSFLAYELSTGNGITSNGDFGVTIFGVTINDLKGNTPMSDSFYSKEEALNYINKLKKQFKGFT
jgi:hypothetical protein